MSLNDGYMYMVHWCLLIQFLIEIDLNTEPLDFYFKNTVEIFIEFQVLVCKEHYEHNLIDRELNR